MKFQVSFLFNEEKKKLIQFLPLFFQASMADCPDIEFNYDDADLQENEMSELYSYTEGPEFQLNLKVRNSS